MSKCIFCRKEVLIPIKCALCGGEFCIDHGIPENHSCAPRSFLKLKRGFQYSLILNILLAVLMVSALILRMDAILLLFAPLIFILFVASIYSRLKGWNLLKSKLGPYEGLLPVLLFYWSGPLILMSVVWGLYSIIEMRYFQKLKQVYDVDLLNSVICTLLGVSAVAIGWFFHIFYGFFDVRPRVYGIGSMPLYACTVPFLLASPFLIASCIFAIFVLGDWIRSVRA